MSNNHKTGFLNYFILVSITTVLGLQSTYGQNEEFKFLEDKEIVRPDYQFHGRNVYIRLNPLSQEILGGGIVIKNLSRPCSGSADISDSHIQIELSSNYESTDTFIMYITRLGRGGPPYYPPAEIIFGVTGTDIRFGENCYKLNCVFENDPWMPTLDDPFFFSKNSYYLNSKNGKIMKGERAINSGRFSSCDLKQWYLIYPNSMYIDKNNKKYKGSELISKRNIKRKDWDMETFKNYWY